MKTFQIQRTLLTVVGLSLVCITGCGSTEGMAEQDAGNPGPDGSVCLDPVPNWVGRVLDRAAIGAEAASLANEPAWEMFSAHCPPVPRGVDARNGEAIYAKAYCDDNCYPDDYSVILYYEDVEAVDECAAAQGCALMFGAIPGVMSVCIPDGAPLWPSGNLCTFP